VSYNDAIAELDGHGNVELMDPTLGIHKDPFWCGPTLSKVTRRVEYTCNVYIPVPVSLFSISETRVFNVEVTVWVSIAKGFPLKLKKEETMLFTNFVRMEEGQPQCALPCK
jgi:hypothetical protein